MSSYHEGTLYPFRSGTPSTNVWLIVDISSPIGPPPVEHALTAQEIAGEQVLPSTEPTYVMPLASVLVSASVGLLTFLSYGAGSANTMFNWLVNVASVASLQSWAGMLFTYIRCVPFSFPLHPQVEFLVRVAVMVCGCGRLTGLVGAGGTRGRCTTSASGGGTTRWRGGRRVSRSRRLRGIGIGVSLMCVHSSSCVVAVVGAPPPADHILVLFPIVSLP